MRFYTRPALTQTLFLHKRCLYTSTAFTQDLPLHKRCLYTSTVFTQGLLLHKNVFTQDLLSLRHCLYTSSVFTQALLFIQALLLHNDILLTKAFCNLQTGNRLEGRRNAEGCKYPIVEFMLLNCRVIKLKLQLSSTSHSKVFVFLLRLTSWHGVKHSNGSQAEGHVHHLSRGRGCTEARIPALLGLAPCRTLAEKRYGSSEGWSGISENGKVEQQGTSLTSMFPRR